MTRRQVSVGRLRRRLRTRPGGLQEAAQLRPALVLDRQPMGARIGQWRDRQGGKLERRDQISPGRGEDSTFLVQHRRRPAVAAAARSAPGNRQAGRAGRSFAPLSDGADRPGSERRTAYRDPEARARHLSHVAPDPALSRPAAREGARDDRAHLLQIRGREPRRQPQAQHSGGPGLLQQRGGRDEALDRNGSGAMGLVARLRRRLVRPRGQSLHGQGLLQPEALPPRADGDLWRAMRRKPERRDRFRPGDPESPSRIRRAVSASRFRKRSKSRPRTPTPNMRWAACSTMC